MAKRDKKVITIGSGSLYISEFTGALPEIAEIMALEIETNRLGYIKKGGTVEYKPTYYEAKDDSGKVVKSVITDEEATLKSGVITWNGETLSNLCSTARVSEELGKRIVRIGGVDNNDGKSYILLFVHKDAKDGDVRLVIVGKNQSGFSLTFIKDGETSIDAEFKCEAQDNDGTLIMLIEELDNALGTLNVTSVAGTTSGTTKIAVTPTLTAGNSYKYKAAASPTIPTYDQVCTTGYTVWDGTADITATTGQTIVMVEVDADNKAKKAGSATITSKV